MRHLLVTNGLVDTLTCDEILNGIGGNGFGYTFGYGGGYRQDCDYWRDGRCWRNRGHWEREHGINSRDGYYNGRYQGRDNDRGYYRDGRYWRNHGEWRSHQNRRDRDYRYDRRW